MSYKKVKIIDPSTVRAPENGYIYLGWGRVTDEFTGPWIKESNSDVSIISGGTGGGISYFNRSGGEPNYIYPSEVTDTLVIGSSSFAAADYEKLKVTGYAKISNAIVIGDDDDTNEENGMIKYADDGHGTYDFFGYVNGEWKSLTDTGQTSGGGGGDTYWELLEEHSGEGEIGYTGYVHIGTATDSNNFNLNVGGDAVITRNLYFGSSQSYNSGDDVVTVNGGVNLGRSTKTNDGTLKFDSGFFGYNGSWKRLDLFDYSTGIISTSNSLRVGGGVGNINDDILSVNGAINIGNSTQDNSGSIKYVDNYFQGYNGSSWKKLNVFDVDVGGGNIAYFPNQVAIGYDLNEYAFAIGDNKLLVSGTTKSHYFYAVENYKTLHEGTVKSGYTGTISIVTYDDSGDEFSYGNLEITNGIITDYYGEQTAPISPENPT